MSGTRLYLFIGLFTLVFSLALSFVVWRLSHRLHLETKTKTTIIFFAIFFLLGQIAGPMTYRFSQTLQNQYVFQWINYFAMGFFASLFFYTVCAEVALILFTKLQMHFSQFSVSSLTLDKTIYSLILALSLVGSVIGSWQASKGAVVVNVTVPISGLPAEWNGFTIAQVNDLHIGPLIKEEYVKKVIEQTNSLKPSMIALVGDFVDGSVDQLKSITQLMKKLSAPYGIFFVTGNHEYYSGAEAWLEEFKSYGFQTLVNEHKILQKGNSQIAICGVTDYKSSQVLSSHISDPQLAKQNLPDDMIKILLAHQPSSYKQSKGYHLQLSGHTHGGQFFPWNLVVSLVQPFYKGLYKNENGWIYTSSGTAYWGPPNRLAVPPEITLLTLTQEDRLKQ